VNELDNIGAVIAHRELGLMPLWKEYMKEQELHQVLRSVKSTEEEQEKLDKELNNVKKVDIGHVDTDDEYTLKGEYYEYTQAAKRYAAYEMEIKNKAKKLKEIFPDKREVERKKMARQAASPVHANPLLKNPKKYRMILRKEFYQKVQYDIPSEILLDFEIAKEGTELKKLPLSKEYRWVVLNNADNAAIIAKYLNAVLNNKYGGRNNWTIKDYENA